MRWAEPVNFFEGVNGIARPIYLVGCAHNDLDFLRPDSVAGLQNVKRAYGVGHHGVVELDSGFRYLCQRAQMKNDVGVGYSDGIYNVIPVSKIAVNNFLDHGKNREIALRQLTVQWPFQIDRLGRDKYFRRRGEVFDGPNQL